MEISEAINLYIKKLSRNEIIGKYTLSIVFSITFTTVTYLLLKSRVRFFNGLNLISVSNLMHIIFLLGFSLFIFGWLIIWKPKKMKMVVFESVEEICKIGNQYFTDKGRLFVPEPWLGLLENNLTCKCLFGKWNRFSLSFNGLYLLGIPELGFNMEDHKKYGFFKYKSYLNIVLRFFF